MSDRDDRCAYFRWKGEHDWKLIGHPTDITARRAASLSDMQAERTQEVLDE